MSAQILDGKVLAGLLKESLKKEINEIKSRHGRVPVVVSILTGNDSGAVSYAASQKNTADALGIDYRFKNLPDSVTLSEFKQLIHELNGNAEVHAILINKPLPAHIEYSTIVNDISDVKDIEGLNVVNVGKLFLGKTKFIPCTAAAVMEHLRFAQIPLKGKEVVIIGRSEIVGKPLIHLLLAQNATVTICHSATDAAGKIADHVRRADVVIVAIGKAGFLKSSWVKPGASVIDVGINRVDGKILGDVDYDSVSKVAGAITPVPGGVGPVTSVLLMRNAVEALKQQI